MMGQALFLKKAKSNYHGSTVFSAKSKAPHVISTAEYLLFGFHEQVTHSFKLIFESNAKIKHLKTNQQIDIHISVLSGNKISEN